MILQTAKIADPLPHALLLSRTGYAYGLELAEFKERLVSILAELTGSDQKLLNRLIQTMTAHGSKGREAHTVIILDATERQFPKIHPDNLLFEIFGTTQKDVLDEERRLFYVAISRPIQRLVILTDKDKESPYLDAIWRRPNATANIPASANVATPNPIGQLAERIRELLAVESPSSGISCVSDFELTVEPSSSGISCIDFEPGWEPPY